MEAKKKNNRTSNQRNTEILPTFTPTQTVASVVSTQIAFTDNSLFIFSSKNKFRIATQIIVSNQLFSIIIFIMIFINTVFLAFEAFDSLRDIHTYANYAFVSIYTIECLLKITAYGFVIGEFTYLKDPWNWLDLLVVVFGLISFLPIINKDLLAMRLLRFIVPLKLLPFIPGMKIFIISFLNCLKDLYVVLLMLLVFIFGFALIGLSIFPRSFYNHCRVNTLDAKGIYPITSGYELLLCGGENKCPEGSSCINSYQFYPEIITKDNIENEINYKVFNYGITNFDSILEGLLIVFMTTTGEGWTKIMNLLMDGYNYYASFIYFIVCLIMNYYFMVNLAISVLIYNFENYSQAELVQEELQFSNRGKCNNKTLRLIQVNWENSNTATMKKKYRRKYMQIKDQETKTVNESMFRRLLRKAKNIKCFEKIYRKTYYHHNCTSGFICYAIYKQPFVQLIFYLCICLNTLLLLLERYNSGSAEYDAFELINLILILVYIFETVLNIIGNGFKNFFKKWINVLDLLVVIISIVDLVIITTYFGTDQHQRSVISRIFRIFRLLRIARLFPSYLHFQVILQSLLETIKGMLYYILLLLIIIYTYTLLGFGLFNSSMKDQLLNFTTFQGSLLTVFSIIIGDQWDKIYIEAYHSNSHSKVGVGIYFVTLIVFGHLTLINIFIAYLIEHFQRSKKLLEKNLTVKQYIKSIHKYWYSHHLKQIRKTNLKDSQACHFNQIKQIAQYSLKMKNLELLQEGTICFIRKNTIDFNQNVKKFHSKNYRAVEREFICDVQKDKIEKTKREMNNDDNGEDNQYNMLNDKIQFYDFYETDYYLDPKMKKYNTEEDEELFNKIRSQTICTPVKRHHYVLSVGSFKSELHGNKALHNKKGPNLRNSENLSNIAKRKNYHNRDNNNEDDNDNNTIIVNSHNSRCNLALSFDDDEEAKQYQGNHKDELIDNNINDNDAQNDVCCNHSKYPSKTKSLLSKNYETKSIGYFQKIKTLFDTKTITRKYSQIFNGCNNDDHLRNVNGVKRKKIKTEREKKIIKIWSYMKNSSLFIFHTDSCFRQFISLISQRVEFNIIVLICILGNVVTISLDTNWIADDSKGYLTVSWLNIIFLIMFIIEAAIKIITNDFVYKSEYELKKIQDIRLLNNKTIDNKNRHLVKYNEDKAYVWDLINLIDFICIILGLVDLFLPSTILLTIRTVRIIRLIRPISLLAKNEKFNIMINSFSKAAPSIGNSFIASLMFIIIFSLLGVNLFKENLRYYCTKSDYFTQLECIRNQGYWVYNNENYANFLLAFKSTFIIMTKENWAEIMIKSSQRLDSHWVYLYYITYLIIGYLFMLNLFKAVISQEYSYIKKNKEKFKHLSDSEKDWIYLQKTMLIYHPNINMKSCYDSNNLHGWLKAMETFVTSMLFKVIINAFIGCSFVLMLIQYIDESYQYKKTLQHIMFALILLFIIELAVKIISLRLRFFYSIANIIDILFVLISTILGILTLVKPEEYQLESGITLAFRIFQILKMIHFLSSNAKIRSVISTLITVFSCVAHIGILFIIILLIYGNIGMSVFNAVPYREIINHNINFKNFLSSSILLFQVMVGEDWNKLMNELAYHDCRDVNSIEYKSDYYCVTYNVTCHDKEISSDLFTNNKAYSCGSDFSYFFFISYIILSPILLMSLCITMTIEGFKDTMVENECMISEVYMKKFLSVWMDYDVNCQKMIKPYEFVLLLKELHPPIGLNYDRSLTMNPFKMKRERERITTLKRVNAFDFKRSKTALSLYASKHQKFFTNDIEVFKITDKLNLTKFSISNNNESKNSNKEEEKLIKESNEFPGLKKEYYIHFVDACIALSRLGISKTESIPFDQLRMEMVNPFMEKYWKNEFSSEKKAVEHYYEDDIKKSTNKIGKYLAALFVFNKAIKQWVAKARNRVAIKKSNQINNANTNNKQEATNQDMLIKEEELIREMDDNDNEDQEKVIENNAILEVKEKAADNSSENTNKINQVN